MWSLNNCLLLALYAIALRWFVFRYKKMNWFRRCVQAIPIQFIQELNQCCFCQTVEAASLIQVVLFVTGVLPIDVTHLFFSGLNALVCGYLAIVIDAKVEDCIKSMEAMHDFPLETGHSSEQ